MFFKFDEDKSSKRRVNWKDTLETAEVYNMLQENGIDISHRKLQKLF